MPSASTAPATSWPGLNVNGRTLEWAAPPRRGAVFNGHHQGPPSAAKAQGCPGLGLGRTTANSQVPPLWASCGKCNLQNGIRPISGDSNFIVRHHRRVTPRKYSGAAPIRVRPAARPAGISSPRTSQGTHFGLSKSAIVLNAASIFAAQPTVAQSGHITKQASHTGSDRGPGRVLNTSIAAILFICWRSAAGLISQRCRNDASDGVVTSIIRRDRRGISRVRRQGGVFWYEVVMSEAAEE